MTDGEVGNDMEIIAEVQKHPERARLRVRHRQLRESLPARQHGAVRPRRSGIRRPEDDGSAAARRFHERVAQPAADRHLHRLGRPAGERRLSRRAFPTCSRAKPVVMSGPLQRAGAAARSACAARWRAATSRARSASTCPPRSRSTTCWRRCGRAAAWTT